MWIKYRKSLMGIIKQLCTAAHKTVWSKITILIMQCNVLYFLYLRECLCIKIEKKNKTNLFTTNAPTFWLTTKEVLNSRKLWKRTQKIASHADRITHIRESYNNNNYMKCVRIIFYVCDDTQLGFKGNYFEYRRALFECTRTRTKPKIYIIFCHEPLPIQNAPRKLWVIS